MVYKSEGKILLTATLAKKNRADSRHLLIVRRRADREVKRLSETRNGREANQSDKNEKDLFDGIRSDAYENHNDYGLYKQRLCQSRVRPRDLLETPSFFRHAVGCRSEIRLFATRRLSLQ